MTDPFPIATNVPVPRRRKAAFDVKSLPLAAMVVGASFLVQKDKLPNGKTAMPGRRIHVEARRLGMRVRVEKRRAAQHQEEGLRVWRVK